MFELGDVGADVPEPSEGDSCVSKVEHEGYLTEVPKLLDCAVIGPIKDRSQYSQLLVCAV